MRMIEAENAVARVCVMGPGGITMDYRRSLSRSPLELDAWSIRIRACRSCRWGGDSVRQHPL